MSWKNIVKRELSPNEVEGSLTHECDLCKKKIKMQGGNNINHNGKEVFACFECQKKISNERLNASNRDFGNKTRHDTLSPDKPYGDN